MHHKERFYRGSGFLRVYSVNYWRRVHAYLGRCCAVLLKNLSRYAALTAGRRRVVERQALGGFGSLDPL